MYNFNKRISNVKCFLYNEQYMTLFFIKNKSANWERESSCG